MVADDATSAASSNTNPDASLHDCIRVSVLLPMCVDFERMVLQQPGITIEMVDYARPGAGGNPYSANDPLGWLDFYRQLVFWYAQGPTQPAANAFRWSESEMDDLTKALAEEPVYFTLHAADENGAHRKVGIFPKGKYAQDRIKIAEMILDMILPHRLYYEKNPTIENAQRLSELVELQASLMQELVWILTHPGADVPWPDDGQWEHAAPAWIRALTDVDFLVIAKANHEVNVLRPNALATRSYSMTGHNQKSSDMTYVEFLGVIAAETGIPARTLMRQRSTGAIYAQSLMKLIASHEAEERAKNNR